MNTWLKKTFEFILLTSMSSNTGKYVSLTSVDNLWDITKLVSDTFTDTFE